MRDIELIPVAVADPEVDDAAYAVASPGGVLSDTTLTDPSFADTKAYTVPSLGGEFGPGRAALLGGPDDGGEALLADDVTVTPVTLTNPLTIAPWPGRSANNTSFENLFPWFKDPPEGLDMNNPNPPPAPAPAPPPPPIGVTFSTTHSGNQGHATFSGAATRNFVLTLTYSISGGPSQTLDIHILIGDTASQIGAKVRAAIDAVFGLDASGSGSSVNVIGVGGNLTYFNMSAL